MGAICMMIPVGWAVNWWARIRRIQEESNSWRREREREKSEEGRWAQGEEAAAIRRRDAIRRRRDWRKEKRRLRVGGEMTAQRREATAKKGRSETVAREQARM